MRKKHSSNLRKVRDTVKMSQEELADKIGTSKAIIENIEMGRTKLSEDLAARISALFGVVPQSLYEKSPPKGFNGKPFTKAAADEWQNITYSPEAVDQLTAAGMRIVKIMLAAAMYRSDGGTRPHLFRELIMELNQFVFRRTKQHDLAAQVDRYLQQNETRTFELETTVGELRTLFRDDEQWSERSNSAWLDSTPAKVLRSVTQVFEPFVGFQEMHGEPCYVDYWHREKNTYDIVVGKIRLRVTRYEFFVRPMGVPPPSALPSPATKPPDRLVQQKKPHPNSVKRKTS